jgi:exodeoxyribonuclease V gamma subunit
MALFVHHGSQLGPLAAGLVQRLAAPIGDVFERLVVAVPTAGVRDWLTRRLADELGVAANIEMPFPGRFFAAAIGLDDADDPWSVERLTWAVLEVLEAGVVDVPGWTAASGDGPISRRFAVARRIADLFDRYATTRPEILLQWQRGIRGDGTRRATAVGGVSAPGDEHTVGGLPASMEWQYELWRHVAKRVGEPSRAELVAERVGQLRRGELDSALPATVELFGVSALSRPQLDILAALPAVRDVHVSLLHPSAIAWVRVAPIGLSHPAVRSRYGDAEATAADSHPLLRSWGRQSSETAAMVRGLPPPVTAVATGDLPSGNPPTLLEHLRADLAADRPPTPFVLQPDDTSIQVHACHGTIRQLEVLRDVLGHLFVADPTMRPDDVLVICPDLERFEPYAAAVFGRGALPVPVTVSDLSLGTENPIAAALVTILHTVAGRCTSGEVLAVAALEAVRRRMAIGADDLDRFARWSERLGTTWGLDGAHRRTWLESDISLGTWDQALRSLLVGAAMPAPTPRVVFGEIVPFDDIGGDDVAAAGRLAELVSRLRHLRLLATERRTIGAWCDILVDVVATLCAAPPTEPWQRAAVLDAIEAVRQSSLVDERPSTSLLAFDDALAVVDGVVADRRGRLRLRTGAVALTGAAPIRNVPTKIVCLLGFDEGSLHRPAIDGDDLLAVRPCVGERDRAAERRLLLLDALLAAEQTVVVTCDGSDVTTNRETRFAVQLTELLDVVDLMLEPVGGPRDDGRRASPVLTRHTLRAYDERNFDVSARSLSFDDVMCDVAETRRRRGDSDVRAAPARWALDVAVPESVTLGQLVNACVRPAATLLHEGLGVRLPGEVDRVDHNIPLSIGRIDLAFVGQRLLDHYATHAALEGAGGLDAWQSASSAAVARWSAAERLRATAPPGRLIDSDLERVAAEVDAIAAAAECCGLDRIAVLGAGSTVDIDLEVAVSGSLATPTAAPRSLRLIDTVGGISDRVICRLQYRRPRNATLLAAAFDLAAAVLTTGDDSWRAVTVTRPAQRSGTPECHLLDIVAADPTVAARALLQAAADLRVAALCSAVPVFERTTRTLYDSGYIDEDELVGTEYRRGDLSDLSNHFVWGEVSVAELMAVEPSPRDLAVHLWGTVAAFAAIAKVDNRQRV